MSVIRQYANETLFMVRVLEITTSVIETSIF